MSAPPSATVKANNARVSLAPCTLNNIGTVRKLNAVLFPIRYAERFYKDILLPEAEQYCQLRASRSTSSTRLLIARQCTTMTSP